MLHATLAAELLGDSLGRRLVVQAFLSAQVEVAMCRNALIAKLLQHRERGHGISPAAESHNHRGTLLNEAMSAYGIANYLREPALHI